ALKNVKKGDKVRVEGKTGTFFGMRVIKPIKVTSLGSEDAISPKVIDLVAEQINDYYIGRVVRVSGKIESVKSDLPFGWRIEIRSGDHKSAQVMVASTVDVDPRRDKTIKEGNHFNITGVLIKFKGSFLVMPRELKDFEPLKPTL
ncbi:MAG: hypothetical protein ISP86_04575, partial [Shewanellaceae bacterium]|nr:hypothetical protein [Shewanellaceae bacterium]